MRNELNKIEKIERYLRKEMSVGERDAFEREIAGNAALREEVRLQEEALKGLQTLSLKQKAQKAYNKYTLGKGLKKWSIVGGTVLVVATAAWFSYQYPGNDTKSQKEKRAYTLPELNENGDTLWADADKYLPYQFFDIDNNKDTVIETEDGIVMAIPAGCFIDQNGKPASGHVQLEVKEAIESNDILKSGLSTRSGEQLLETGGMVYLNARQDGASLGIDPRKGIYTEIPTDEIRAGMQVYEGKRMPDGTIDWINPKPMEKFLLPVDIHSLNFYPPEYEDTLAGMGKDIGNKLYKDSLYYSFAYLFSVVPGEAPALKQEVWSEADKDTALASFLYITDSSKLEETKGINPSKIKAIWNNKFNNTLLATREFEERLPYIHRTCKNSILDLYVNNLDKKLCTIDSMAANIAGGYREKFLDFAARGDGRIQNGAGHFDKLKKYYAEKTKAFTDAIAQTEKQFWKKHQDAQEKFNNAENKFNQKDAQRVQQNFTKEFSLNLKEAYRQLGYVTVPAQPVYGFVIMAPGWKNVDQAVYESTLTRTTLDYTDPLTGRKAMIKYEELTATIKNRDNYDAVFVYVIPDQLDSYMRLKEANNNIFIEKLNELFQHEMVCVAYKGGQAYYKYIDEIRPGKYDGIELAEVSSDELDNRLKLVKKYKHEQSLLDELSFRYVEQKEKVRFKKVQNTINFRDRMKNVIFPCAGPAVADTTSFNPGI